MNKAASKGFGKESSGPAVLRDEKEKRAIKKGSGVVEFCINGPAARVHYPSATLVEVVHAGLNLSEFDELQSTLAVSSDRLGAILGMSKATLHRRKLQGRLDSGESDRVVRFAKLMGKAIAVFESRESARQWLNSPQFGLGGAVPLEYADTEVGAREVENLLGRIDEGVYS